MRMRFVFLLGTALAASVTAPAVAQPQVRPTPQIERRVDRIEQELRAVQRRVFPDGVPRTIDPEIVAPTLQPLRPAAPDGDALTGLGARIDALEAQLARVTGQVEENGFRLRQLEEAVNTLRTDTQARLSRFEQAAAPRSPTVEPVTAPEADPVEPAASDPATPAAATDPAEAAYNAGYRLWEARRYAAAQTALVAAGDRYPSSRWASWARNLAGRAYLDDNKPANAARIFLANYQAAPRGERAADSLFFLGEALVRLNRHSEACPVYDELQTSFPQMRDFLRTRLPTARRTARCPAR